MYSSSYSNRDTSLSSSNQPNSSFCDYNHENLSEPSQDHYHPTSSSSHHLYRPHYIALEDELVIREFFQQQRHLSSDRHYHDPVIGSNSHDHLTRKTLNSTMEKSCNNDGIFATDTRGDHFNSGVILENKSLTGKRASKKDRHSKINTAKGPRDRRMRLSLDVAKKFFRLQDMLGFDKASNTIEWLLMKSKPAIQDLLPDHLNQRCSLIGLLQSESSASEGEVMSGIDDQSMEKTGEDEVIIVDRAKSTSCSSNKEKKKIDRGVRKSAYMNHSLAKETREQARERARKRTTEKRNNKLSCGEGGVSCCDQNSKFRPRFDQVMDQNVNRLGSWIPFRENQVQTTDQAEYPCSQIQYKQAIVGDNSSAIPTSWSPSFLFNYQHNAGPSHEHQFNDFPFLGKPWEGNDS
ncbi:hypothetical protein L2E82_17092 [Cichorium intybus]|uniref:Uncharacterized protein n=1 Tax=Cichorium intybus TaxID=13427 RepID=A0ACB9F7Z0_CICIN|nr:hypothetical protein L2E82_17092 [Cichorium intybus]